MARPGPAPASDDNAGLVPHREIAAELGVSRQFVAVLERRALRKCRRALARRGIGLRDFFDAMRAEHHVGAGEPR
jgi:transcriptional regulator